MTSSSNKTKRESDREVLRLFLQVRARQFGLGYFRVEFMMKVYEDERNSIDYEKYVARVLKRINPALEFVEIVALWDFDEYFSMDHERLLKYGKLDD